MIVYSNFHCVDGENSGILKGKIIIFGNGSRGDIMKYPCPCCGYKTLQHEPPRTYDICEICFWEDDDVQFDDPDYEGGANLESLRQYQKAFLKG